jgi:hypothetical protein
MEAALEHAANISSLVQYVVDLGSPVMLSCVQFYGVMQAVAVYLCAVKVGMLSCMSVQIA